VSFFATNIPTAVGFVVPHSLLPPKKLYGYCHRLARSAAVRAVPVVGPTASAFFGRPGSGRLAYNCVAAATLHFLLRNFAPLTSPLVASLPFPNAMHVWLSVGCLLGAMAAMVTEPSTYGLLGVGQALRWSGTYATPPEKNTDAITWMGVCSWRGGKRFGTYVCAKLVKVKDPVRVSNDVGALCFVLFTGVSILPRDLTLGDCLTRGVAAFYLRTRSKSFRKWVASIEKAHLATWCVRACLLVAAFRAAIARPNDADESGASARTSLSPIAAMACAGGTALTLRLAESHGDSLASCFRRGKGETGKNPSGVQVEDEDEDDDTISGASVVEVSFTNGISSGRAPSKAVSLERTPKARRSARLSSRAEPVVE